MTTSIGQPCDIGLQAERTALSWQRTILSFAIASLVGARFVLDASNTLGYIVAASSLVIAAILSRVGHRRYVAVHRLMSAAPDRIRPTSAAPLFAWALMVWLLALVGFAFAVAVAPL